MKNQPLKAAVILIAVVAGALLLSAPWSERRDEAVVDAVAEMDGQWVGRQAPNFELPTLDGQTERLSDYRGNVVFLNFWASFCKPCREEMPSMETLAREYGDRGFEMIAVSLDPRRRDSQAFLERFLPNQRTAMNILWDPESNIANRFGTELIPETYIIDRDGNIVARFVNEYDWTRPEARQLVEALL